MANVQTFAAKVEGGMRQDYKSFGSKGNAFLFKNGVSNYEVPLESFCGNLQRPE